MVRGPSAPRASHAYLALPSALSSAPSASARRPSALSGPCGARELGEAAALRTSAAAVSGSVEACSGDWERAETFERSRMRATSPGDEAVALRTSRARRGWLGRGRRRRRSACRGGGRALSVADDPCQPRSGGGASSAGAWRRGHPGRCSRLVSGGRRCRRSTTTSLCRGKRMDHSLKCRSGSVTAARCGRGARRHRLLDRKGAMPPVARRPRFADAADSLGAGGAATAAPSGGFASTCGGHAQPASGGLPRRRHDRLHHRRAHDDRRHDRDRPCGFLTLPPSVLTSSRALEASVRSALNGPITIPNGSLTALATEPGRCRAPFAPWVDQTGRRGSRPGSESAATVVLPVTSDAGDLDDVAAVAQRPRVPAGWRGRSGSGRAGCACSGASSARTRP